jgi:riboflavin kinase / FMN adenylyltransferase
MPEKASVITGKTAWLTIGTFDGVHLGHQAIISSLVRGAHAQKKSAVVATFFPHPAEILRGINGPYYLNTLQERENLLKEMGVDEIVTLNFSVEFAKKTAHDFIQDLYTQTPFSVFLVGYDFHFGAKREGDISILRDLGKEFGFEVRTISPKMIHEQVISSSAIRQLILRHEVHQAAELLGRWYAVSGEVVHGDGRGKHIGVPTANVAIWPRRLMPASGVYAARVEVDNHVLPAVLNIGNRPTFYFPPAEQTVEVHILDFHEELYGKTIKVNFIDFIRLEKRFESAVELMDQIRKDIQTTREVLAHAPNTPDLPA